MRSEDMSDIRSGVIASTDWLIVVKRNAKRRLARVKARLATIPGTGMTADERAESRYLAKKQRREEGIIDFVDSVIAERRGGPTFFERHGITPVPNPFGKPGLHRGA
jgi:hypothetical protein